MAIKKGVNHSNNKERCSAGNLDDLLWKYCKLRYTNLSCSDVHWNFWRMCNALRLGSEVYDWYRLLHRFGEEGAQVFKKSLHFLFCILLPALSLQSAFYTQSAVYPWSAGRSLRLGKTEISGTEPARPLIWTPRKFYKGFRGEARSRKPGEPGQPGSYEEALTLTGLQYGATTNGARWL